MRLFSIRLLMTLVLLSGSAGLQSVRAQEGGDVAGPPEIDILTTQIDLGQRNSRLILEDAGGPRTEAPNASINLPEDARKLLSGLDQETTEGNGKIRILKGIDSLQKMQDVNAKAGKLDEAVAIRDSILDLRVRLAGILPSPGNMTAYRGRAGESFQFVVTGRKTGSIWGTSIYTDDSDLGTVAVHYGLLRDGQKGVIKVTILPGQESYEGSPRNGIASQEYAAWDGSYFIEPGTQLPAAPAKGLPDSALRLLSDLKKQNIEGDRTPLVRKAIENLQKEQDAATRAGQLDEALAIREQVSKLLGSLVEALPDPGTLTNFRGQNGQTYCFEVTGRSGGTIWGSGLYTDDSDIGTVAVHAGLLREGQKGIVRVTLLPGRAQYQGSSQNGITSSPYQSWEGSYTIEAVRF